MVLGLGMLSRMSLEDPRKNAQGVMGDLDLEPGEHLKEEFPWVMVAPKDCG